MALAALLARAPQSYPLIEQYIVANLGRLAHDSAHTVINEATAADGRTRMYLDTGQETTKVREKPGNDWYLPLMKPVSYAVKPDGMKARIGQKDLDAIERCGVMAICSLDILTYTG
jgi:hypothetical protein